MNQDLILKDVADPILRENFVRIQSFIAQNVLFRPDFKFFEVDIPLKAEKYPVAHGLTFVPTDFLLLNATGDYNFYLRADLSDRTNLYISTQGPVRLRFLAGRFNQTGRRTLKETQLPFVAPKADAPDTVTPTTPVVANGGVTYRFATPMTQWVINHNLGYYPATTLFNNGGAIIEGDVVNTSMNQVVASFNQPTAGYARLV